MIYTIIEPLQNQKTLYLAINSSEFNSKKPYANFHKAIVVQSYKFLKPEHSYYFVPKNKFIDGEFVRASLDSKRKDSLEETQQ